MSEHDHEKIKDDAMINHRVTTLEKTVEKIAASMESIAGSLSLLARLEERHEESKLAIGRAFAELAAIKCSIEEKCKEKEERMRVLEIAMPTEEEKKDVEDRLKALEVQMPTLDLVKNWVIAGVIGIVAMVGIQIAQSNAHTQTAEIIQKAVAK